MSESENKPNNEAPTAVTPEYGQQPQTKTNRSGLGFGFLLGVIFSLLLAAYPLYVALDAKYSSADTVGQQILASLQMQITLTHKELESIERQLEMIAEAEEKYSNLVDQKFDLETSKNHLDERLAKLEAALTEAEEDLDLEANQFDQITSDMRLD